METNNNNNEQNEVIFDSKESLPPLNFGGGHSQPTQHPMGYDPQPQQQEPQVQPIIEEVLPTTQQLNSVEEAFETRDHPKSTRLPNLEVGTPTKKRYEDERITSIPTDTEEDEKMFKVLTILYKIDQQEVGRSTSRYRTDAKFRDMIDSLVTEEEVEYLTENELVNKRIREGQANGTLNVTSVALKGSNLEKLKFNKDATNNIPYGNGLVGITTPKLGSGNIVDNVTAFKAAYRGTSIKIVNLIHSGFTVKINPPSVQDTIILNQILHKEEIAFAKDTATLINSNKRCYLLDPIVTFIRDHIISYSLNVPANKDIMDYIDIRDYDILLAAIITSMNGESVYVNYRCANGYVWDDDNNRSVCTNEYTLKLDMDKMLFIERDFLPVEYIKQLTKKDPNTVDVTEVAEYKRKLDERLEPLRRTIVGSAEITFRIPSIQEYLDASLSYIDEIKDKVSEANVAENELDRENILKKIMTLGFGMEIANSIESMKIIGRDVILTKPTLIAEVIADLKPDESKQIYDACKEYLEEALVAKICYPKSYCQECMTTRPETIQDQTSNLTQLTPINMLGFFYQAISILGT